MNILGLEMKTNKTVENIIKVGGITLGIYGISQLLFANIYSDRAIDRARSPAEKNAMQYHNATHDTEKTGRKAIKESRDSNLKRVLAEGLRADVMELERQHSVGLEQLTEEASARGFSKEPYQKN